MKNPNNLASTNDHLIYLYELKGHDKTNIALSNQERYLLSGSQELSIVEEKRLRIESASIGAEIALNRLGLLKDDISQNEAFRIHGRALVESWANAGYVTRVKAGNGKNAKATYSRTELETVAELWKKRKLK